MPGVQPAKERSRRCPTLVLGVGNILLRDEGVGVRVVQAMENLELPSGVELLDGGTAGADLLDELADRRKVIVIDAMAGDDSPGTVTRMTPEDLAPRLDRGLSLHDLGLLETLALARQAGAAPDEVVIIGVKPHSIAPGLELTPETARLVPRIIEFVMAELE